MADRLPSIKDLFNPILEALRKLGGSGTNREINAEVIAGLGLPDDLYRKKYGTMSVVEYRSGWARWALKEYGLVDNSARGVWTLTEKGRDTHSVDPAEIERSNRARKRERATLAQTMDPSPETNGDITDDNDEADDGPWRNELHRILTNLAPDAFERLVQRLLRESGFIQVEVTGKTGDGGIDGKGIARIHGLMSFHVIFQCKRYQGAVSAGEMRNFRGAMAGRTDKGLFITTGTFSSGAYKEATRDGPPPIDLIDGEALADKLRELELGVKVEMVERATVDADWFRGI